MIIDTHAHYDDESFDQDRELLLQNLPAEGIGKVLNAGASVDGALRGLALAERFPNVWCALGVHPNEIFPEQGTLRRRSRRGSVL